MIEIRSLTRDYGPVRAVDHIDLDVPDGQVLGLLGPNGAGKTTTIRMLTGYLPPSSGAVHVDGFNSLTESSEVRRRLGYLPESNPLYTEMRVDEYLRFRARMFGIPANDRSKAIERVIERCWLAEMRKRLIGHLSKGYRQRVGLAAALLHSPPVLVLDEPTSGLDPVQIRETRNLIRELAGDHTMILSSHILPEVERTVDRIVIIARGRICADGTVADLQDVAGQTGHYVIEIKGDGVASTLEAMRKVKDVKGVDTEGLRDGWTHVRVTGAENAGDLREQLGEIIRSNECVCRELSREGDSIEQLFVRIAHGEEGFTPISPSTVGSGNGRDAS